MTKDSGIKNLRDFKNKMFDYLQKNYFMLTKKREHKLKQRYYISSVVFEYSTQDFHVKTMQLNILLSTVILQALVLYSYV